MSKREREPEEEEPGAAEERPAKRAKLTRTVWITQANTDWCVSVAAELLLHDIVDEKMNTWFDAAIDRSQTQWRLELPAGRCAGLGVLTCVFGTLLPHYAFWSTGVKYLLALLDGSTPRFFYLVAQLLSYCNCDVILDTFQVFIATDMAFTKTTFLLVRRDNKTYDAENKIAHLTLDEAYDWACHTNFRQLMHAVARIVARYPNRLTPTMKKEYFLSSWMEMAGVLERVTSDGKDATEVGTLAMRYYLTVDQKCTPENLIDIELA